MTDNFKNDFLKGSAEFTKNTPFSIWPETNLMLDDFYKRPDVNIIDDNRGLNIKNSLITINHFINNIYRKTLFTIMGAINARQMMLGTGHLMIIQIIFWSPKHLRRPR